MSARALLNNECSTLLNNGCSSPQKDGCSCPLKIMGARPHFSREHFMNLFFYESFLYSCVFIHLFPISVLRMMSARALLDSECSSPQKDGCSSPPKIMGARPHFFKRAFHELISFMFILQLFTRSPFDCSLNNECSCPPRKWVLEPSKRWVLEPPKIMGARTHFFKRAFSWTHSFHVHFAIVHLFSIWLLFE